VENRIKTQLFFKTSWQVDRLVARSTLERKV